jgi:hypothetical protein
MATSPASARCAHRKLGPWGQQVAVRP